MDLLFWKPLVPNIICEPTRKQFFGKFCYKLVLKAFGGRVINDNNTVSNSIAERIQNCRTLNYGGSWRGNPINDLQQANIQLLDELKSIKNGYDNTIKIRIEEPWIQIYAVDEETLKCIAQRLIAVGGPESIISVSTPESESHQTVLESGCIIVKKDNGYKYKVILRDGSYGTESKAALLNYMFELGDEIKYSHATYNQLSTNFSWIWGCYFYVNDLSLTTAIALISPGIIGKIHELKVIEQ
jgi:hypothetical protein